MIELLSPAGDFERLKFALRYGADAVYIGGKNYSLRANAINFTNEEIKEATKFAHSLNKKVYVTVNIVLHDENIDGLKEYLLFLDSVNVDAIIVSDIYIMSLWKELNLKMELHVSTQASTLNKETALFYKELGASRVVLAREASEEDIKEIKDYTGLDLEAFIHGAMCTSISGRCIMSNYATNRDANRGGCAQVCRWNFALDDENGNELGENYQMCPKDLNMAIYIKDMIDAGVNSFKIEGRMRSIYYIATVLSSYRKIIDDVINNRINDKTINYYLKVLNRCANRESNPQFFKGLPNYKDQYYNGNREVSNQDFLGVVLSNDNGLITLEQRNYFKKGTIVEFISPNFEETEYTIEDIYDEDMNLIEEANHAQMIVKFETDIPLCKDDIMRLKTIDKESIL
ncbi:MAG: U32 family peptidase [Ruminococcaceae bacterium]|nr:U32 family peptidase [Oscillospiraceae bacterium]